MEFEKRTEKGSTYASWLVGNKYKYDINWPCDMHGIEKDNFYKIISEIISLLKTKGLTVRQAKAVLTRCEELILDTVNMD